MSFKKEDVLILANAIIDDFAVSDWAGDSFGDFNGYICEYCYCEKSEEAKDLKHDLDCPVLVAQDVLTRN